MRMLRLLLLLVAMAHALPVGGQTFQYGDVIVGGNRQGADSGGNPIFLDSTLRIYGRDGAFKRELFRERRFLTEPFYRDGIVYVGARSPDAIERIDAAGNRLTPFTTAVYNINFLSPGPGGGLLAVNGSGEIYEFAADATLVRFRDFMQHPNADGGIELARDQCTIYYTIVGSVVRWDVCNDTEPRWNGSRLATASNALRILPDGTFLIAVIGLHADLGENRIIHVDRDGNLIRFYGIPGHALALDVDGKTFWTNWGSYLLRVNIETGEILSTTQNEWGIYGLSVVGEPRAALAGANIPAISPGVLVFLALLLTAVALIRLRMG